MNNNQLKNLLQQSFDNHEVIESQSSWGKLSRRLSFQNFLKFGTKHINIYNTSLGAGFLFMLYFSVFANVFKPNISNTKTIAIAINKEQYYLTQKENTSIKLGILTKTTVKKVHLTEESPIVRPIIATHNSSVLDIVKTNEQQEENSSIKMRFEKIQSKIAILKQAKSIILAEYRQMGKIVKNERSKPFKNLRWSIDLFTVPVFSDAMSINNYSQSETIKQKVAAGFAIKCIHNKYVLETGFVYKSQSKHFNQTVSKSFWTSNTVVDTVTRYNTNLMTGKRYKTKVDTIYRTEKQLSTVSNNIEALNTYTTMEIPINIGYRINYKKFISTSKIGIITYISKRAVGKTIQNNNNQATVLANVPMSSTNFTFTISNSFSYRVKGPVNIFVEPYLKFSDNSPRINELSIGANKTTYGLKLGVEIVL
jgi:hypothetical protein